MVLLMSMSPISVTAERVYIFRFMEIDHKFQEQSEKNCDQFPSNEISKLQFMLGIKFIIPPSIILVRRGGGVL